MAERVLQGINNRDSDSDVQEIDPPVLPRSTQKRRRRIIHRESIDRRFCRCTPRKKKTDGVDSPLADSAASETRYKQVQKKYKCCIV
jgi:hypothetical protein